MHHRQSHFLQAVFFGIKRIILQKESMVKFFFENLAIFA